MTIRAIKIVFFDLDGTLCYFRTDRQEVLDIVTRELDAPRLKSTEYIHTFEKLYRSISENVRVETFKELLVSYGLAPQRVEGLALSLAQRYGDLRDKSVTLFPHTKRVLEVLRNSYSTGLLTNGPLDSQRGKIARLALAQYFDKIIISGGLGVHKPDSRIFNLSIREVNLRPCDAVHVGDSLRDDVLGAKKARWFTIWINRGEKPIPGSFIRPDWEIKELCELIDLLL